ncbi:hypothetical protein VTL71DRAFT_267 [Oculimacula yallundae]|uniref:Uncharacterized protein n=1 Tax=Oculimacula yallundae TaxID=86028 RepID=A0ABR4CZL3_9HELO
MPKLPVGKCASCDANDVTLRPNPFTQAEQCEGCREEKIIGVSDLKTRFGLKDTDLKGLTMKTEPKPAFLGGADRRWYLVEEVEKRAEEVEEERERIKSEKEAVQREKEDAKKEKAKEKEDARKEKEDMKKEKEKAKEKKTIATPVKGEKRKRDSLAAADGEGDGNEEKGDGKQDGDENEEEKPAKRGRGRPPKEKSGGSTKAATTPAVKEKAKKDVPVASKGKTESATNGDAPVKRGRGRPPKAKVAE